MSYIRGLFRSEPIVAGVIVGVLMLSAEQLLDYVKNSLPEPVIGSVSIKQGQIVGDPTLFTQHGVQLTGTLSRRNNGACNRIETYIDYHGTNVDGKFYTDPEKKKKTLGRLRSGQGVVLQSLLDGKFYTVFAREVLQETAQIELWEGIHYWTNCSQKRI
ncbi:hypothetical protein OLMES_5560 [Oleiphilus messinensis]|uniref:Uncharacterized protein n=1 Tax=Oleiphilus messinensis TaxID=141451 RepID=A0A1Y0IGW0_9GAMM|nr:hypothetical protein [Oleiphilus messinensis]ARU59540.1 hypothetical protein OLMES_5560 [Oleiphilus messinensis]